MSESIQPPLVLLAVAPGVDRFRRDACRGLLYP